MLPSVRSLNLCALELKSPLSSSPHLCVNVLLFTLLLLWPDYATGSPDVGQAGADVHRAGEATPEEPVRPQPNIVFILADDLGKRLK